MEVQHDIPAILRLWTAHDAEDERNRHRLRFATRAGVTLWAWVKRATRYGEVSFALQQVESGVRNLRSVSLRRQGALSSEEKVLTEFVEASKALFACIDKCPHCSSLYYNARGTPSCVRCADLLASAVNAECIICKTRDHPVAFSCRTCVDSQICSMCYGNLPKKGCQVCRKRKHPLEDMEQDEEDEEEEEDDDEDEDEDMPAVRIWTS
jgi:hypothetical protein